MKAFFIVLKALVYMTGFLLFWAPAGMSALGHLAGPGARLGRSDIMSADAFRSYRVKGTRDEILSGHSQPGRDS